MRPAAVVLVALAALTIDAGPAHACSYVCERASPRPGQQHVPRNAEIVFTTSSPMETGIEAPELWGTAGVVPIDVDTDLSTPFGRTVWRVAPKHPLAAETDYALSWGGGRVTSFRTGTTIDSTAPSRPVLHELELGVIINHLGDPTPCGPREPWTSGLSVESEQGTALYHVVLEHDGVRTSHVLFPEELGDFTGPCGIISWLDAGAEYCVEMSPRDLAGHVGASSRACTTVETCLAGDWSLDCGTPAVLARVGTPRAGHFVGLILATVVWVTLLARARKRPQVIPRASME